MKLIFVSSGEYPNQRAAAIRHSTIVQGIVEDGHDVTFYLVSSQHFKEPELIYNGIKFISLNSYRGNNIIFKKFYYLKCLYSLRKEIIESHNIRLIDAIIVYSIKNTIFQVIFNLRNKTKIKIFHERTELPYVMGNVKSVYGKIKYYYYINFLIPKFDGIFVISDKLLKFFAPYNENLCKLLSVVDTNFFTRSLKEENDHKYIAYCGTMAGKQNGVPILIESFAKLVKDFPEFKLLLIGNTSNPHTMKEVEDLIEILNIREKIIFTGFIEREEMPKLLQNASLLVLSKPDNEQNSGNFPIKIGEYLSTGKPIVVTKVGEIPNFIVDGVHGYLAEPDSVDSFYNKMKEALFDYNRALRIGANGQKLAQDVFDYKIQAREMLSFIRKKI